MLQNDQEKATTAVGMFQTALAHVAHADEQALRHKLMQFASRGPGSWHMVLDFDRTLTCANASGQDFFTWSILDSFLPQKMQSIATNLYNRYRPLELSGELTEELALEWWNKSLKLLQDGKVNLFEVEREFMSRASIRPGIAELFAFCKQHNIPTVILSAGVTDVIEIWCRHHGIKPDIIMATRLKLTPEGHIAGWDQDGLIHALNKHERGHGEIAALRVNRPNTILVGDSMDDARMVEGEDVLRARIYDLRPDEADNHTARTATLTRFDLMLANGTLLPLVNLMKEMNSK